MTTSENDTWKVIVLVKMRKEIMEEHPEDSKGEGHFGVMKTHEKLGMSLYYWPEMRKSVEK